MAQARGVLLGCITALGLVIAAPPTRAATVIDRGPIPGTLCSDVATIDSTCLLPIAGPYADPVAVTSIAIGEDLQMGDVLVAHPVPGNPGSWTTSRPQITAAAEPSRWQPRTASDDHLVDTAIALAPGDELVMVDPPVRIGGTTTDLELASPSATPYDAAPDLTTGTPVGVETLAHVTVEPDTDGDGWGDETEDLCPQQWGIACGPGSLKVAVDGPQYVPALDPVQVTWQVTNTGASSSPVILNISAQTKTETVAGPPGMTCAPGYAGNPTELFVPSSRRSPLTHPPFYGGQLVPTSTTAAPYGLPATGTITCRLPSVAPGTTVSGTITGTGMDLPQVGGQGFRVQAVAPFMLVGSGAAPAVAFAYKGVWHADSGKPTRAWAPGYVKADGPAASPGALTVRATCNGPVTTCAFTGELRAPVGGKRLAAITAPLTVDDNTEAKLAFTFTAAGLRWLAAHPRTKTLRAVLTASYPRELPTGSSTSIVLARTASFRRQLRKLARAQRSH